VAIVKIVTPGVVSGCTAEAARCRLTSVVPGRGYFDYRFRSLAWISVTSSVYQSGFAGSASKSKSNF